MPPSNSNNHWQEQFAQERTRLLTALGELTEGGIVENVQHIGATSVPGLPAWPCVDIGLSVWPFPLEPHRQAALDSLGYALIPGYEGAPEQRFRHSTGAFQLYVVDAGSELWTDYLVIRNYLRHNEDARQAYATRKQEWAARANAQSTDYQIAKAHFFLQMRDEARQRSILSRRSHLRRRGLRLLCEQMLAMTTLEKPFNTGDCHSMSWTVIKYSE